MTIQQLSIVLSVAKEGSISKGAEKLYISQPSASANIAALEAELGYDIFARSHSGAVLTERGRGFVSGAQQVLAQLEALRTPSDKADIPRLRVGVLSYTPTIEAFLKLYRENASAENADFSCVISSAEGGIRAVARMELDIAVVLLTKKSVSVAEALTRSLQLELHRVCAIPINLNLRKGHPYLDALPEAPYELSGLAAYPCVAYRTIPDQLELINVSLPTDLRCSHTVTVDERDTRCRIVSETNAYSIGCRLPDSIMRRYGLVSITLSDDSVSMYYIIRKGESARRELRRYLELLDRELEV